MKKIIIRDDDISFFTKPELLDMLYTPLWEKGYAVCLAVIPAQSGNTSVLWRPGQPFDPSIPPAYRGDATAHPITENPVICAYLHEKVQSGLVEICLHGYCHEYHEFGNADAGVIRRKLEQGMAILQAAFPDVPIQTFIAPYDVISPQALEQILAFGLNISTKSESLIPLVPEIGSYQQITLPNGAKGFTSDEYLFTHREDPQESMVKALDRIGSDAPVVTIVNHYWTFFHDWQAVNPVMLDCWHQVVEVLLSSETQITSFAGA